MTDITNEAELTKTLEQIIKLVIEHIAADISDRLQRQIETDIFTQDNQWYERTGEFENAWDWTPIRSSITEVTTELFYNSSKVHYHPKEWIHGNPGESAVENLADILNLAFNGYSSGYTSNLMFGERHFSHLRRPYWSNLMKTLFDKGDLDKMFDAELKKYGLERF